MTAAPGPGAEGRRLIEAHRSAAAQLCEAPSSVAKCDAADRALAAYVAGLEAEVARLKSTLAMPTHMLVPRALPSGALKAAERHCDWTQVQHAWGAILNWVEVDTAKKAAALARLGADP